jgi:hypothetical protein
VQAPMGVICMSACLPGVYSCLSHTNIPSSQRRAYASQTWREPGDGFEAGEGPQRVDKARLSLLQDRHHRVGVCVRGLVCVRACFSVFISLCVATSVQCSPRGLNLFTPCPQSSQPLPPQGDVALFYGEPRYVHFTTIILLGHDASPNLPLAPQEIRVTASSVD